MRQQITVRMDSDTGPVFHGASGALYGLSDDSVPGADLLAPLHIRTISQKPPGGLQHPTGDADKVAPGFFGAGGELIFVNMQDIYQDWPYKDCGIDDYLTKIKSMVASADSRFAFIPFNEPDWIWYDLKTADADQYIANRNRFLADWTATCQAIRREGALIKQGSAANPQGYAAAGGADVGPIGQPGSRVEFGVSVPHTGRYLLCVYYGNQTEDIAQQIMRIDDQPWSFVTYPPTLNVPGVTHPATHYPSVYADLSGGATVAYAHGSGPAGYVTAPGGSRVGFVVQADHDGYHRVSMAGSGGNVRLLVGGTDLGTTGTNGPFGKDLLVYLHAGINRIDWVLSGTAVAAGNPHAYGGQHVGWIGNGADSTLTFTRVSVPRSGTYRVILSYACNDRAGSDNYNANLISRGLTVSTSAARGSRLTAYGLRLTAYARNTYSWNQFNTRELTVRLAAGENTITFGNPAAYAPDIDKITVAPALLP